jgi:hypothetical protein
MTKLWEFFEKLSQSIDNINKPGYLFDLRTYSGAFYSAVFWCVATYAMWHVYDFLAWVGTEKQIDLGKQGWSRLWAIILGGTGFFVSIISLFFVPLDRRRISGFSPAFLFLIGKQFMPHTGKKMVGHMQGTLSTSDTMLLESSDKSLAFSLRFCRRPSGITVEAGNDVVGWSNLDDVFTRIGATAPGERLDAEAMAGLLERHWEEVKTLFQTRMKA